MKQEIVPQGAYLLLFCIKSRDNHVIQEKAYVEWNCKYYIVVL